MKLSTQTLHFVQLFGYEEGVRRLCLAGYDCLDLTLTHLATYDSDPMLTDSYRELALKLREIANGYGVTFNQSHAPYQFKGRNFFTDECDRQDMIARTQRAIEIAGLIGAKAIVIHPLHRRNYHCEDRSLIFEENMQFYGEMIEKARECGVKIAVENMWQRNPYTKAIVSDVCSNPYEHAQYVDQLNNRFGGGFVACLDIGHCALTGAVPEINIRVLGDRLEALHVHDNNGKEDLHSLPFTHKIDFVSVMQALKEIGYKGELTYEADKYLQQFPKENLAAAADFMIKTGRYLTTL